MLVVYLLFYMWIVHSKPPSIQYRNYRRTNGYDQRPNIVEPDTFESICNIRVFFEKKRTLDALQNPNIPLHLKLPLIEDRVISVKSPDLFAGGLMDKFNFDF
jgi:hypothetical protein